MNKISIIIPVYNESKGIAKVLHEVFKQKNELCVDEIIVVDDGSTDNSGSIASNLGAKVIRHENRRGYGNSLKTGIRNASNEILVFLDGDGQHNPSDIKTMTRKLDEGYDLIAGERRNAGKIAGKRKLGKFILKSLTNFIANTKIIDVNCGFRVTKKSIVEKYLALLSDQFSFSVTSTIVFIKMGYRVGFSSIDVRRRLGRSHVNPISDGFNFIILVIRLIVLFEPIRIFFSVSAVLLVIGVAYGGYKFFTIGEGLSVGALSLVLSGLLSALMGVICDQISCLRLERYK